MDELREGPNWKVVVLKFFANKHNFIDIFEKENNFFFGGISSSQQVLHHESVLNYQCQTSIVGININKRVMNFEKNRRFKKVKGLEINKNWN